MTSEQLELLKYPIGKMYFPERCHEKYIQGWIEDIAACPSLLQDLLKHLDDIQLDTAYRLGGWTIRQLVHHLADSHSHAYIRFKWALSEDDPLIKAYDEKAYAALFDSKRPPVALSLDHLKALHAKWVFLLEGMEEADFRKTFRHPENQKQISLLYCLAMYSWHCRHHCAHIEHLMKRRDWI
ncbi:putative metal-dependent hydrolase [Salegentibacter sp. F188]|uniref:Metal-dependent hydrolase n=1 Tax=Autumnicola patrickiae TaxID=3075591 RepID=A0ABU3E092_9FLAO|nr:putative metal-dependent hydrolase [Salegentibacter sp. F188]MDT0688707.1 putative metal-dependent hydrolase [Salegentibacter sp. F188]